MTLYVRAVAQITISTSQDGEGSEFRLDQREDKVLPIWVAQQPGFQRLWAAEKVEVATDSDFQNIVTEIPEEELFGVSSVNTRTGDVTLTKSDVGLGNVDNTADASKEVLSATKLATARTINGVSFDGSSNITVLSDNSDGTASTPA